VADPGTPARFENGYWIGARKLPHVNSRGEACPQCQKIVYNKDSPLSDLDVELVRKQHADIVVDGVRLHSQETLDRAQLMVDDAQHLRKVLLDKYPPQED
jgi:hypothetical protein